MWCSFDSGSIPVTQGTIRGLAMQHSVSVAFTVQEGVHSLHSEIPCIAFFLMDAQPHSHVIVVAIQAWNTALR